MLKKRTRFSTIIVACLIFTLVFSFSTAFGITLPSDHTCGTYDGIVTKDTAATKGNITGPGMTGSGNGTWTVTIGDTKVQAIVEGTTAHITVIEGAIAKVAVKAANSYRYWYFDGSIQPGECVEVTSAGCFSNGGNEKDTIGDQALHGISHLVFGEGTVEEEKGSITIDKEYAPVLVDESPIAEFQLFDENKAPVKDGQGNNVIATIDGKKIVTLSDLELGEYYIKEITSPSGYTPIVKVGSNLITADSNGYYGPIAVNTTAAVVINVLNAKLGTIEITKTYAPVLSSDANLTATFELYTDEEGNTQAKDAYGDKIQPITITNASITPSIISNLVVGKYYLKEAGPSGYNLSIAVDGTEIQVNDDGLFEIEVYSNMDGAVEVSAVNTKTDDTGSIRIYKQWEGLYNEGSFTGQSTVQSISLPEATFTLYDSNHVLYTKATPNPITITGNDYEGWNNLPVGTYYIKEVSSQGYTLTSPEVDANGFFEVQVTKDDDGPSVVIEAVNSKAEGDITITKQYSGTVYDKDVKFILTDKIDDGIYEEFYLGSGETTDVFTLPVGTYYLTEEIPSGYSFSVLQGNTAMEKTSDGSYIIKVTQRTYNQQESPIVVNFTALNSNNPPPPPPPPGKVSIQLNKQYTSITTGTNPTAIFFLYSKNGTIYTEIAGPISISGAGTQTISNLDPGTYYLQESSMDGYALDSVTVDGTKVVKENDGYYKIQATNAGTTVSVTALNSPPLSPPPPEDQEVDEELPMTGGNTIAFLLSGGVLTALGILVRRFQK